MADLRIELAGLSFANPVTMASGTAGYGRELAEWYDLDCLGGFFTKAVTLEPRAGNPQPRVCELPTGMLNSIGLANPGVSRFLTEEITWWEERNTLLFVNVAGSTIADYTECCRQLGAVPRLDGLELNVSCPNVKQGGISFSADPVELGELVKSCRAVTGLPLIVKLSPQVTDVAALARVCEENGADALSLINTIPGLSIDITTRRPRLSTGVGGYSGPGIKPVALAQVHRASRAVGIPVIGIGGISSAEDIIEFMLAGASVVQLGTHNFIEPTAGRSLIEQLDRLCGTLGVDRLQSLIGAAVMPASG